MSNSIIKDLAREQALRADYFGIGRDIFIRPGEKPEDCTHMREPWQTWLTSDSPSPADTREFFEGYTEAKRDVIFGDARIRYEETPGHYERSTAARQLVKAMICWHQFEVGAENIEIAVALNKDLLTFAKDIDPYHTAFRGRELRGLEPVRFAYCSVMGSEADTARAEFVAGSVQRGPWPANADTEVVKALVAVPSDDLSIVVEGLNAAWLNVVSGHRERAIHVTGAVHEYHPTVYDSLVERGLCQRLQDRKERQLGDIEARWGTRTVAGGS